MKRAVSVVLIIGFAIALTGSAEAATGDRRASRGPLAAAASDPCVNVLSTTKGSVWNKVAAGLACRLRPSVWAAKCLAGVGSALSGPVKALKLVKDVKTAKGLYDLRRVPKRYRAFAKLYNHLALTPAHKKAPKGFRTGRDIFDRIQDAGTIRDIVLLLPNIRRALNEDDYSQVALDLSEILDVDDCVRLLAGRDPSVPSSMTLLAGRIAPLEPLDPNDVPGQLPLLDPIAEDDGAGRGSVSISNNNGQMAVQVRQFPTGNTPYFCHAGNSSEYPTGGTVTGRGQVNITSPNQNWSSGVCTGGHNTNMWIGFQGTDGHDYYSNQTIIDVAARPGASVSVANNNGQMLVQVAGFPTGTTPYFCHAGSSSEYPYGGVITARGQVGIASANQSWASGLCSGGHNTNMWIGFQGTDGHDYYSNQVVIDVAATPGAKAAVFGSSSQMSLEISGFPTGRNYWFCHQGDPSQYPYGGAVIGRGHIDVGSPNGTYGPLCSGSGNAWIGVQGADGHDYYSNQISL